MITIRIKGTRAETSLTVLGYENTTAENTSDANWLKVEVDLRVGSFSGLYSAAVTTHDFFHFKEELNRVLDDLKGKAVFLTDEGTIELEVEIDAGGKAVVTGKAKVVDLPKVNFSFHFETDQTYLNETLKDVETVIRHFPIVD